VNVDRPTTLRFGDIEIARIGLGTNRLANTVENVAFVKEAAAAGVGMIDTAHTYTGGESEQTIGAALSHEPAHCVIATKGGGGGGGGRGRPGGGRGPGGGGGGRPGGGRSGPPKGP
jgi:aryl-alcohol dehydrogenase-like predicted oxidoreductase